MKRIFLLVSILFLTACEKDSFNNRNPYIPNYNFESVIDMNLPLYSALIHPGNAIYYADGGALGLIVFNTGSGYVAYDAACPNQAITSCSRLQIDGVMAICPCDSAEYNLFTGQSPGLEYPMKPYRVSQNGTVLIVRD